MTDLQRVADLERSRARVMDGAGQMLAGIIGLEARDRALAEAHRQAMATIERLRDAMVTRAGHLIEQELRRGTGDGAVDS